MACSCGPGRYDLNYEEKGIDYPYHTVPLDRKAKHGSLSKSN